MIYAYDPFETHAVELKNVEFAEGIDKIQVLQRQLANFQDHLFQQLKAKGLLVYDEANKKYFFCVCLRSNPRECRLFSIDNVETVPAAKRRWTMFIEYLIFSPKWRVASLEERTSFEAAEREAGIRNTRKAYNDVTEKIRRHKV